MKDQAAENPAPPSPAPYEVVTGVLTTYFEGRGFGFLELANQQRSVFVHVAECPSVMNLVGFRCRAGVYQSPRGLRAAWIEAVAS